MATPTTLCSRSLTIPIAQTTWLVPFKGLQSREMTSCCRLGPTPAPSLVQWPAHALGAAHLCKPLSSRRIHVGQGFLSVDASSFHVVRGVQRPCCPWKRRRLIGVGRKFTPYATAAESSEVLVSEESSDSGDRNDFFGEASVVGQRRLQVLRERGPERTLSLEDLASLYEYPLDEFQINGISGFLEGSSLVVCAPTSSGKTLIAEAAAAAVLARGKRLLYTTPLKALSNQKLREFQEFFGEENVGLLTGDTAWNRKAPIVIMTTEILRNMLYESAGSSTGKGWLVDVDAIVLDEVHYLSDNSRGTVVEETYYICVCPGIVIELGKAWTVSANEIIYCPKDVQLICLSATIANPEELVGWITRIHGPTKLVAALRRPVPLQWHFSTRQALLPLLNANSTAVNPKLKINHEKENKRLFLDYFGDEISRKEQHAPPRTSAGFGVKNRGEGRLPRSKDREKKLTEEQLMFLRRKQVPKVKDTLTQLKERDMLPAIWFIFSRKGCDLAVSYVEECDLLSDDEARLVQEALRKYQQQYPDAVRDKSVKALMKGAAAHHAGCLPTWKAFIEELFQKGLVKVVFTTETLAAGINMPARTAVLSSMSKRGNDGHTPLGPNAMLQMAGRAGRRGVDDQGHVVVMQTPFEGAEECCELLLAGPEPLVSQFTTTYGMALNLLAGPRVADSSQVPYDDRSIRMTRRVRSLDEARALVEQSFGNFVGSDVLTSAQENYTKLRDEIERLQAEDTAEGIYSSLAKGLTKTQLREYKTLSERISERRNQIKKSQQQLENSREEMVEQVMVDIDCSRSSFVCIEYVDRLSGQEHVIPVACVGRFPSSSQELDVLDDEVSTSIEEDGESAMSIASEREDVESGSSVCSQLVAIGADNRWYMFSGGSVRAVYNSVLSGNTNSGEGFGTLLKGQLQANAPVWQKAGESGSSSFCAVWTAESQIETLAWSCQVPLLHEHGKEWQRSSDVVKAEKVLAIHNEELKRLNKKLQSTQGFRNYKLLLDLQQKRKNRIANLQSTAATLAGRMKQLQPSGWKDFLQVMSVLQSAGFLDAASNSLLALGEIAADVRGANELWLTLAFTKDITCSLKPSQLAAACSALVSDGMKTRHQQDSSSMKVGESRGVRDWIIKMEDTRAWLLKLQASHGVEIAVGLNKRFAGTVEAWACGISWQELVQHSGMDEGDLARLLRQTLDLVSQIAHLPHVSAGLRKNARAAREAMDRSPISELFG